MTDPIDEQLLEDLARLLGAGGVATARRTAVEIRDVLDELGVVLDEHDQVADQAVSDEDLLDSWSTTSAEARAAVLLTLAWRARTSPIPAGAGLSVARTYAEELLAPARNCADSDEKAFYGPGFPALPLPGPSGVLATRLAFNADDLLISLETALLLLVRARARQR